MSILPSGGFASGGSATNEANLSILKLVEDISCTHFLLRSLRKLQTSLACDNT